MNVEQAKVFLGMGDSLKLRLNEPLGITFILWPEDYDPDDPEPFEVMFGHLTDEIAGYTIVRDDGTGLELLRKSHEEKQIL
jgi:hypothetical protein